MFAFLRFWLEKLSGSSFIQIDLHHLHIDLFTKSFQESCAKEYKKYLCAQSKLFEAIFYINIL